MAGMNLITIENLTKQYSERLLFDRANLQINEGDRIGLIGVNGSGKSTLLRIVAGLESPDSGAVAIPGGVRIEYLAQEPALDDGISVLETIFRSDSPQMRLLPRLRADESQVGGFAARRDTTARFVAPKCRTGSCWWLVGGSKRQDCIDSARSYEF